MGITVTESEFSGEIGRFLDAALRSPVTILGPGAYRRAVVVSPAFFDRAVSALEDLENIQKAQAARDEHGYISHDRLKAELGID
ncbi:prevent-host-death family protein [Corynebacterium yudongzhengii]|uniref:Prevent-host-death family protein n=1 Tax=Corynebacterium yudongzhengii TaxID=2080740 RepID=A0A2U1T6H2_9CORY|nr:prevent-host-death family protein [Corynebacterium yudongzhengii]AWB82987.1 prevent-host-death family protein [Corynebacterium yudongzhengii]PWC01488.1 prevent-host-death family protein [Corynebacterium yudongzhengii]